MKCLPTTHRLLAPRRGMRCPGVWPQASSTPFDGSCPPSLLPVSTFSPYSATAPARLRPSHNSKGCSVPMVRTESSFLAGTRRAAMTKRQVSALSGALATEQYLNAVLHPLVPRRQGYLRNRNRSSIAGTNGETLRNAMRAPRHSRPRKKLPRPGDPSASSCIAKVEVNTASRSRSAPVPRATPFPTSPPSSSPRPPPREP